MLFKPALARRRNCVAALLIAGLFLFLYQARVLDFHEPAAVDLRFLLRGPVPSHADLILVEVDKATLENTSSWPWPRSYQAQVLAMLESYGPRLIYWGIPVRGAPSTPESDSNLASIMEKGANVVLPFFVDPEHSPDLFSPGNLFLQSSRGFGFLNFVTDPDGHVRRIRRSFTYGGSRPLHHAAVQAVLSLFRDEEQAQIRYKSIPVNNRDEFWISFPGPLTSFRRISLEKLLQAHQTNPEDLNDFLKGRVVIVGGTAEEISQPRPAVFGKDTPAIAIQASAIHTLLTGGYLREASPLTNFLFIFGLSLTLGILASWLRPRSMLILALSLISGYWSLNIFLFWNKGWVLPFFAPAAAVSVTYVTLIIMAYLDMRFQGELLSRELSMAARVQATFLPHAKPDLKDIDLAFECRFAKDIGGDFYDWMDLGGGLLGLAVGDVAGKGIPAAIYMVRAISELRRENRPGRRPSELLEALNGILVDQSYTGMFLTISYALIDQNRKHFVMSLAGHESFIYYSARTRKAEVMKITQGPPLGVFPDSRYPEVQMTYEQGDALVLLSDGVTELRNARRQPFGLEKICRFIQENAHFAGASELVAGLISLMEDHRERTAPHDDRTLLCVKFGTRF